jgi:5-hydroxyisourate hydrolase
VDRPRRPDDRQRRPDRRPRPVGELTVGVHRLTFDTAGYCESSGETCFFPEVTVTFAVTAPEDHHHVPLLLSPFGYSTYRGS